ncbi:carbohydrate ABC transporter permease [Kribbella pittospori]|uniref:Carbohydrate ABC transporter permease n=1 Tax=Kribbella pittospori TaxID=722689 RepID=A0A4R0JYE0_9ACTN|nr:carbohydrate ABC transporter permease [Kribbella pittospori]TCC50338.1 carbohydrate ABC transporter permease [Kribbella pittospori]
MTGRYGARSLLVEFVMIAVALVFAFPLYVLVVLSLKSPEEAANSPLSLPSSLYLRNYTEAWAQADLAPAIISSVVITVVSVFALVVLGALAAYTIARRTSRLSGGVFALFLVGLVVPFQLALIPLYQLIRDAGLLGSYWSVILYMVGTELPLTIFLYVGFLRATPVDYEEAAMLDGASPVRAFWSVVFPLMRPVTGTVMILNAIGCWNAFLVPNLFLSGTDHQTIPVAVYSFVGEFVSQWNLVFAGLVIGMAPILVVYLLLQRRMIRGFASGLKG